MVCNIQNRCPYPRQHSISCCLSRYAFRDWPSGRWRRDDGRGSLDLASLDSNRPPPRIALVKHIGTAAREWVSQFEGKLTDTGWGCLTSSFELWNRKGRREEIQEKGLGLGFKYILALDSATAAMRPNIHHLPIRGQMIPPLPKYCRSRTIGRGVSDWSRHTASHTMPCNPNIRQPMVCQAK